MSNFDPFFEKIPLFTRSGKEIDGYAICTCDNAMLSEMLGAARRASSKSVPQIAYGILSDWDLDADDVRKHSYQHQVAALTSFLGLIPDSASIFVVLNGRDMESMKAAPALDENGVCLFDDTGTIIKPFKKVFARLDDNKPAFCSLSDEEAYSSTTYIGPLSECSLDAVNVASGLYVQHAFSFVSGFALLDGEKPFAENEGAFMMTLGDTASLTHEFIDTFNQIVEDDIQTLKHVGPDVYFGKFAKLLLEEMGEHPEFAVPMSTALSNNISSVYTFTKKCDDYLVMWEHVLKHEDIDVEDVVAYARLHPEFDFKQFASIHGMYEMAKSYANNGNHAYDVIRKVKKLEESGKWGVPKKHKYIDPRGKQIAFPKASTKIGDDAFYERGLMALAAGEALLSGELHDVDLNAVAEHATGDDWKSIKALMDERESEFEEALAGDAIEELFAEASSEMRVESETPDNLEMSGEDILDALAAFDIFESDHDDEAQEPEHATLRINIPVQDVAPAPDHTIDISKDTAASTNIEPNVESGTAIAHLEKPSRRSASMTSSQPEQQTTPVKRSMQIPMNKVAAAARKGEKKSEKQTQPSKSLDKDDGKSDCGASRAADIVEPILEDAPRGKEPSPSDFMSVDELDFSDFEEIAEQLTEDGEFEQSDIDDDVAADVQEEQETEHRRREAIRRKNGKNTSRENAPKITFEKVTPELVEKTLREETNPIMAVDISSSILDVAPKTKKSVQEDALVSDHMRQTLKEMSEMSGADTDDETSIEGDETIVRSKSGREVIALLVKNIGEDFDLVARDMAADGAEPSMGFVIMNNWDDKPDAKYGTYQENLLRAFDILGFIPDRYDYLFVVRNDDDDMLDMVQKIVATGGADILYDEIGIISEIGNELGLFFAPADSVDNGWCPYPSSDMHFIPVFVGDQEICDCEGVNGATMVLASLLASNVPSAVTANDIEDADMMLCAMTLGNHEVPDVVKKTVSEALSNVSKAFAGDEPQRERMAYVMSALSENPYLCCCVKPSQDVRGVMEEMVYLSKVIARDYLKMWEQALEGGKYLEHGDFTDVLKGISTEDDIRDIVSLASECGLEIAAAEYERGHIPVEDCVEKMRTEKERSPELFLPRGRFPKSDQE